MNVTDDRLERSLGPEWDETLLSRVRDVVAECGGTMRETSCGVGGSQEVTEYEISMRGALLTVIAETYVGLLLRGPRNAVEMIAGLVTEQRGDI